MEKHAKEILSTAVTVIWGRVTYQGMHSYWPSVPSNPSASQHETESCRVDRKDIQNRFFHATGENRMEQFQIGVLRMSRKRSRTSGRGRRWKLIIGGAIEMAKLIYPINVSLDGYMEDERGNLEWSISDDELFAFWTDFQRPIGTYLYGRRMYESMVYWETASAKPGDQPEETREFAQIWRAAEKIVYSRTLQAVSSASTRIEREFDADAIRRLKKSSGADITIGGPELAGQAMSAGLIDECHLLLNPIVLGGRKRALPDNLSIRLELLGERRFRSGVVHLHYRVIV